MPVYTKADIKARINAGIKNKIGLLTDANQTINDAVRSVNADFDLRSTRRMVSLQPGVFDNLFAYPAPSDIKAQKLVSLSKQSDGNDVYYGYSLIPYEQFNAKFGYYNRNYDGDYDISFGIQRELYTVAFDDVSMVKTMLIAAPQDGVNQTISGLDSLIDGGGLWTSFGDAENVDADNGNYVQGSGSIKFDIDAAGGLTAGIYNATLNQFSIADFLGTNASYFTFAYLSNIVGVNSYTLRIGTNATNYYEITVTSTHANTAFQVGYNTLQFTASEATIVGAPDPTNCTYVALFMNKEATKISEDTFRFDSLVAGTGSVMNIRYYSKFPWQSQAGVWMENSTEDDDFLNLDSDEYDMVIDKGIMVAGDEVDETTAATSASLRFDKKLLNYKANNPSGALVETVDYQAQYYI